MHQRLDALFRTRRKQELEEHVVGRPGRIVDQDLLDETRYPMLDLVDEAQLVGVDVLVARRTVKIARLQRELVHEPRQKARLVDRRQVDEVANL